MMLPRFREKMTDENCPMSTTFRTLIGEVLENMCVDAGSATVAAKRIEASLRVLLPDVWDDFEQPEDNGEAIIATIEKITSGF